MNKLDILKENQKSLLLAEAVGWLWYGKECQDSAAGDEVFCKLVEDTLAVAKWPKNYSWNKIPEERQCWMTTGKPGRFQENSKKRQPPARCSLVRSPGCG